MSLVAIEVSISTGIKRRLPEGSVRKSRVFVVAIKIHCLKKVSELRAYAGLKVSSCLDMKCLTASMSAFLIPESSAISISQAPCICSRASLPWTVIKVSLNHSWPSFFTRVLFPAPCPPTRVKTRSNFIPGLRILPTPPRRVTREASLVYMLSSAPK